MFGIMIFELHLRMLMSGGPPAWTGCHASYVKVILLSDTAECEQVGKSASASHTSKRTCLDSKCWLSGQMQSIFSMQPVRMLEGSFPNETSAVHSLSHQGPR